MNLILLLSEEGEHKKYHQSPPVNSNAESRKRVSEREKKSRRKKKFPLTHSRIFPLCATVFGELELSKHTEENREKILRQLKKKRDDGEKSNGRLSRFESTIFLSIFLRTTS